VTAYDDRIGRSLGAALIIDESPYSAGDTALEILNFRKTERGILESRFLIMPLIHPAGLIGEAVDDIPDAFNGVGDAGCLAIAYANVHGGVPEVLFLCGSGVFRYATWGGSTWGGTPNNAQLAEQLSYGLEGQADTVSPQGRVHFPPQWETVGNRIYFTWCDGGGAWVWDVDNKRLRTFGYDAAPHAPDVQGPAVNEEDPSQPNQGGFSVQGRVGTVEADWTEPKDGEVVGGIDAFERIYYAVLEGVDGHFSPTSAAGGHATMRLEIADKPSDDEPSYPDDLRRRFRVMNIPLAPTGTAAVILLATSNLKRLPPGDDGSPRFLHRIPGGLADQWIDDIPDGELGAKWQDREPAPLGFYLLKSFSGSLFIGRTDGNPSRVWWSEQTNVNGPTPESIMAGHWRDVYPSTGPLTAFHEAQFGDSNPPMLLVFKEQAVHFLTGTYPEWQVGTLHRRAGAAGPNLVVTCPDGAVLWYGARTFWRLDRAGNVTDIGRPIRKRLRRVNYAEAKMGCAFVDRRSGEVIFSLPIDDSLTPNFQFVWDWEAVGWRTLNQMVIKAACEIAAEDLVFLSGTYDGFDNVYIWDRGAFQYQDGNSERFNGLEEAIYQTGWLTFGEGAGAHAHHQFDYLVVVGEESYEGTLTTRTFRDWVATPSEATGSPDTVSFTLAHPEDEDVPYYDGVGTEAPDDPATFDEDKYRDERPFTAQVPINIPSAEVVSVSLRVASPKIARIVTMSIYGSKVAGPGARTPRVAEGLDG
jgi:hypothetical protein